MKNFVNIARTKEKPLYVDAAGITGMWLEAAKGELTLFNEKGTLLFINYRSFDIDPETMLKALASEGNALLSFPSRFNDENYARFISPAAFTYAAVSQADKDGKRAALVGVKGVGREESTGLTPEELQGLLDAVKKTGKIVLEYKPDEAHARRHDGGALYVDPMTVREIRESAARVDVRFEGSGSLDLQTGKGDGDETLRHRFAASVAAANSALAKIKNTELDVYVRLQDFDYVSFHNDEKAGAFSMTLSPQRSDGNPFPQSLRVIFKTAADRAEAFDALNKPLPQEAKKPAPPAPATGM